MSSRVKKESDLSCWNQLIMEMKKPTKNEEDTKRAENEKEKATF